MTRHTSLPIESLRLSFSQEQKIRCVSPGPSLHPQLAIALLIGALVCCTTFGCGGKSASKPDAAVEAYADRGYTPEHRFETTATRDTWTIDSEPVNVRLLVPAQAGSYPLVIYLPGLGESADAGLGWRQAWAQAGYAVLSAQPTRYGPAVWSSSRARGGDFLDIAKDAFGTPSLATRTQLARGVLDEVSRRHRVARDTAVGRGDITRVAVAGYDLGAQTAMMVAGESVPGVEAMQVDEGVKCVIALSPYADFSGMGVESNFRSIRLPVLAVTSAQDTDAYGLVRSAAVRRAPFQYMPPGQKYLLILSVAPHSLLGGAGTPAQGKGKYAGQRPSGSEGDAEADTAILSDEATVTDPRQRPRNRSGGAPTGGGSSSAQRTKEVAQVQGVTTAFLDAFVKNDPIALEWLSRNAKPWLGETADLQSK
jgi:dienelactone hydrolase